MALIGVIVLLMVVELLNTAIEKLSDHVTPTPSAPSAASRTWARPRSGLSLLLAGLVWLVALAERFGLL